MIECDPYGKYPIGVFLAENLSECLWQKASQRMRHEFRELIRTKKCIIYSDPYIACVRGRFLFMAESIHIARDLWIAISSAGR